MTVDESFVTMQSIFNPSAAAGLNKTFQFNISGEQAGTWVLKVANQTCELVRSAVENPSITFNIKDQDWLSIAEGKLDAMNAFMTGKVKVTGDMMLAMRLQNLFPVKR
jgi:putative sterol carrier protein